MFNVKPKPSASYFYTIAKHKNAINFSVFSLFFFVFLFIFILISRHRNEIHIISNLCQPLLLAFNRECYYILHIENFFFCVRLQYGGMWWWEAMITHCVWARKNIYTKLLITQQPIQPVKKFIFDVFRIFYFAFSALPIPKWMRILQTRFLCVFFDWRNKKHCEILFGWCADEYSDGNTGEFNSKPCANIKIEWYLYLRTICVLANANLMERKRYQKQIERKMKMKEENKVNI